MLAALLPSRLTSHRSRNSLSGTQRPNQGPERFRGTRHHTPTRASATQSAWLPFVSRSPMRPSRRLLRRRAAAPYVRLMRNRATGGCLPSSMTIRHSLPAREAKSRPSSSADRDPVHGHRPRRRKGRQPPGPGHGGDLRDLSVEPVRFSVRRGATFITARIPVLIRGATSLSIPDERLHGPVVLERVLARLDQYAVHGNATGYAAKEEPCREDDQRRSDDGDEQTLPRCGNCQQPVELFTFFLGLGNGIVKRVEWIIEHDRA